MQDLFNEDGVGIRFNYSGGVILVLESSSSDEEIYLGKVSLEKDGSYTATPDNEYKYGTVREDECKPQTGFMNEHYAALYLVSVASIHNEYSNVTNNNAKFIKSLIGNNFK